MNEEIVNEVVTEGGVDTSTESPESTTGIEEDVTQELDTPAEVENTDTSDDLSNKRIPKSRLDEEINKKKELQAQVEALKEYERFKEFKGYTNEEMSALINFQNSLMQNPELANSIQQAIDQFNTPKGTDGEPLSPLEMQIKELQGQIQGMQKEVGKGLVEKNLQSYDKEFKGLVEKDFTTEAERRIALHFTDLAMSMADQNYHQKFDKNLFTNSYNESKELVNKFKKEIIDSYLEANKKIDAPVVETGASATESLDLTDSKNRKTDAISAFEKMAQLFNTQN